MAARYWWGAAEEPSPENPLAAGLHRVVRVVDGDTIIVAPNHVVRLIGVDTPETVKPEHPIERFGPEATQFTRKFLSAGAVHLTFDRERVDQFGRFLAYVWVGNRLLNEELLRVGLGRFEPNFPYSYEMKGRFQQAQDEAQEAGIGLWSSDPDDAERRLRPRHDPAPSPAAVAESDILRFCRGRWAALGSRPASPHLFYRRIAMAHTEDLTQDEIAQRAAAAFA